MKILAIDTSCDETSVAVSLDDKLQANIISSQVEFHKEWGGVVPIIAKRNHNEKIEFVIEKALKQARYNIEDIDVFAVTYGPGLAVALEVGVNKAKQLASKFKRPLVAVDHMAGHIYANFTKNRNGKYYSGIRKIASNKTSEKDNSIFPLLALLISGGHTEIIYMSKHLDFHKVGKTLDDSLGEAYDKIANMLGWGYPGGPIIEQYAKKGDRDKYDFPVPMKNSKDLNFSYSGLKTAVLYQIKEIGKKTKSKYAQEGKLHKSEPANGDPYSPTLSKKPIYKLTKEESLNVAASFEKAATEELKVKLKQAVDQYPVNKVLLGGGVVNNLYIRKELRRMLRRRNIRMHHPRNRKLLSDNAGMITTTAYYMAKEKQFCNIEDLDRKPRLSL
ncbi:tRNA (adenosine(37)-N6)-threonylcarbamoyltransferase complex transferase subunit TsaD [Candidatus Dojkabacteria bacterium]|nr:tRNA (adenosine(37)-N6)-threonylcarbamoyltransferase complex transferase subunit TsaD [Candidatus Dojkabacteria bacterium]